MGRETAWGGRRRRGQLGEDRGTKDDVTVSLPSLARLARCSLEILIVVLESVTLVIFLIYF